MKKLFANLKFLLSIVIITILTDYFYGYGYAIGASLFSFLFFGFIFFIDMRIIRLKKEKLKI